MLGNRDLFAGILETTRSNLNRYYQLKKMTWADREYLWDTICLYGQAILVFGNLVEVQEWVHAIYQESSQAVRFSLGL